jgi:hypothetical protein
METLVAVIVTALTVTVFFQVLSASMNLERRGRDRVQEVMAADLAFAALLREDIREADFPWNGEGNDLIWTLRIFAVQTAEEEVEGEETALRLSSELYRYEFAYSWQEGPRRVLHAYIVHPLDFFDDDFQAAQLSEPE